MQVKVKKNVLFNLLKKALNENRTFDNPGGNFIHSFDRNESMPIEASPHMATQLSVEMPPVEDENYIPASISELRAAASRIAEEVPSDQIERYYRYMHKLLDAVLDKSEEGMLAEARSSRGYWEEDDEGPRTSDDLDWSSMSDYETIQDLQQIEKLKEDPTYQKLQKKMKKDPYFDGSKVIDKLSRKYNVQVSDIEDLLYEKEDEKDSDDIAVTPTSRTPTSNLFKSNEKVSDGQELPKSHEEESEDEYTELDSDTTDRLLEPFERDDYYDLNRDNDKSDEQHKALNPAYWTKAFNDLEKGKTQPLQAVAQAVIDSMDAVSRVIGTEIAVRYTSEDRDAISKEEIAWKGILNNKINTNHEVIYALPAKQKTEEFWKPRVVNFINKFSIGEAGSLSGNAADFKMLSLVAFKKYSKESGLDIVKFMNQVANRVVDSILNDAKYGALTRNKAGSSSKFISKIIEVGFTSQIKKYPFELNSNRTFLSKSPDPNSKITHAGEEKTFKQAVEDAIISYVIIKSDDFRVQKRGMSINLDDYQKDKEVQNLVDRISQNESFTFTEGSGQNKDSYVITKKELIEHTKAFVDQKFEEAKQYQDNKSSQRSMAEDDKFLYYLEDPAVPEEEKKERFTNQIGSAIMKNKGSISTYTDYYSRVINRKFDMGVRAFKDMEDPDTMYNSNYISIFNDTLAEIIPATITALKEIGKEGIANGLDKEDLEVFYEGITQIQALEKFVYSSKTSGGERTIENLKGNIIKIDEVEYDALDFFSEGRNTGPAILRYIVSDIMGASLKGTGMQNIETINLKFEEKVKRIAENFEDELMRNVKNLFSGINMQEAQEASYMTGRELGIPESKAKFLENDMKTIQPKISWMFVGRVSPPNFDKLNVAAKNLTCWFTAIADKKMGGAATLDERKKVAKELYEMLSNSSSSKLDKASDEVEKIISKTNDVIDKQLEELEQIESFTEKQVKRLRKDPELMKNVVKQAMKMHLEDIEKI